MGVGDWLDLGVSEDVSGWVTECLGLGGLQGLFWAQDCPELGGHEGLGVHRAWKVSRCADCPRPIGRSGHLAPMSTRKKGRV